MGDRLSSIFCFIVASHLFVNIILGDFVPNKYFYVADDQNNMRRVYNSEPVDENVIKVVNKQSYNVYCLYTRENPYDAEILEYDNDASLESSYFDPAKITVFIIHGWLGNRSSTVNTLLTEVFLQDDDINVIVVDWCKVACSYNYFTTTAAVPAIGRHVGKFILWLTYFGLSLEKIHLVGHSLGAHVAGLAGRETNATIRRISGLDPAGPLWDKSRFRLTESDAQYVEVIHTNTKCLGSKILSGDADFFPNGGESMPGCVGSICSHSRSYYYMAETVKANSLYGLTCGSMDEVKLNICEGEPYLMGNSDLLKNGSGIFRANTDDVLDHNISFEPARRRTPYRRFLDYSEGYDCTW